MNDPSNPMTLQRFETILDAYGADSSGWPLQEREAAVALLKVSELARHLQKQVAQFDVVLTVASPPPASPKLKWIIMAKIIPRSWRRRAQEVWPFGSLWRPAMAMVFSMVLGVVIGGFSLSTGQYPAGSMELVWNDDQEAEMLLFGPDYILESIP
jgi:hypothetical protein